MKKDGSQRGDTAILFAFLSLAVLILGTFVFVVLAVGNLRRAGDVAASSQSFYAANAGVELGLSDYAWSDQNSPTCTSVDGEVGSATYRLVVRADTGGCPKLVEVQSGVRALCIESTGKTRQGAVRRRVTDDIYDPTKLPANPCQR